jgi:hypothetical protein
MVPSELIGEGSIGGLLVFLGCWSKEPYSVPDQQGDTFGAQTGIFSFANCANTSTGIFLCLPVLVRSMCNTSTGRHSGGGDKCCKFSVTDGARRGGRGGSCQNFGGTVR